MCLDTAEDGSSRICRLLVKQRGSGRVAETLARMGHNQAGRPCLSLCPLGVTLSIQTLDMLFISEGIEQADNYVQWQDTCNL